MASTLPHTAMSRYIESRIRRRLILLGESEESADTITVRLVSNVEVKQGYVGR
ncbi:unnamed protein product, partial [Discosporangium mesarthrocarpum]